MPPRRGSLLLETTLEAAFSGCATVTAAPAGHLTALVVMSCSRRTFALMTLLPWLLLAVAVVCDQQ
ncbi:hypothetical protein KCP69_00915 [Salmonella enterica subsp. enterica]|nr:hypothetical protein KCP69_00915 [Salmonella enterica subsp. enterica]